MQNTIEPRWLTRAQVATYLNLTTDRLRRLIKTKRLPPPSYHLGERSPRFDRFSIDSLLQNSNQPYLMYCMRV